MGEKVSCETSISREGRQRLLATPVDLAAQQAVLPEVVEHHGELDRAARRLKIVDAALSFVSGERAKLVTAFQRGRKL